MFFIINFKNDVANQSNTYMKKQPFLTGRAGINTNMYTKSSLSMFLYEEKAQQKMDFIINLVMKHDRGKAFDQ